MEPKDIKLILSKFLKKIFLIIKDIKTLPNVWLYIILAIVLTGIFFIFTFPYNTLIRNQLQKAGETMGRSAEIGDINFNLLTGANISSMTIFLKDGSELNFQDIDLDTGIISALLKKTLKGRIQVNNIKYGKDKTSISMVAGSDFNLEFNSFSESPSNGKIKLNLQNVIAKGLTIKGFDIPPVRFSSIYAEATIVKKKINLDAFQVSGPDLKGSIDGTIMLTQSFLQSQLNLNITIDSSSPFLENYRILLSKWINSANKIQLTVRGSASNPVVTPLSQKNETSTDTDLKFDEGLGPGINPVEKMNIRRPVANPVNKAMVKPQPVQQFGPADTSPSVEPGMEEPNGEQE